VLLLAYDAMVHHYGPEQLQTMVLGEVLEVLKAERGERQVAGAATDSDPGGVDRPSPSPPNSCC
jgi:hypothetical protein